MIREDWGKQTPQVWFLIYEVDLSDFIQGVLSLTFGEDATKSNKDKDAMYSARPKIEVLLLPLICKARTLSVNSGVCRQNLRSWKSVKSTFAPWKALKFEGQGAMCQRDWQKWLST